MSAAGGDRGSRRVWELDRSALQPAPAVALDSDQQQVVDHRRGPLLVLAGPGTGKTTTIVEAIVARLQDADDPIAPEQILALTFGRRAAADLRDRLVGRLDGGVLPTVATFHSFAYGLLQQTASAEDYREPPKLLSGAEEDVRIRELLVGAILDGTIQWPDDLQGAVGTLGLVNEVRAVLAKAKLLRLDADQLQSLGKRAERPAWEALGELAAIESQVMALENVLDYVSLFGELLVRLATVPNIRERFRVIAVDEYQDTDPLQIELLRALVGPHTNFIAVGDPDQAIYGFRGADASGLIDFPSTFGSDSDPAPIVVLGNTRRFGPAIREAATCIISKVPLRGLPADVVARHRHPSTAQTQDAEPISIRTYDSELTRAASIAQQMREQHLHFGVAWSQMAVLARSGQDMATVLRGLRMAGVPAVVAADEIPLRLEPAVGTLLLAAEVALHPQSTSVGQAVDLLSGPLGGLDVTQLRQLGRALRAEARVQNPSVSPPPADQLIAEVLKGTVVIPHGDELSDVSAAVDRLRQLLDAAHRQLLADATPTEVLWQIWSGQTQGGGRAHGWPDRLRRAALNGSGAADHDLDAVMALFDTAHRSVSRFQGFRGMRSFLSALKDQALPAESVAERSVDGEVVRVLTAHRAKGQEWDCVWIIGLQEGIWPDLRRRGSVLEADRLTRVGIGPAISPTELLAEERRLLYVAMTRARRSCTLAVVQTADEAGQQPSRFLDELQVPRYDSQARSEAITSLPRLVARLRTAATDQASSPALRAAALQQLSALAQERDDEGQVLIPAAQANQWWGVLDPTALDLPIRPSDMPIGLSGSAIDTIITCPLRWFLEHDVHADVMRGEATKFGSVIHALADFIAKGEVADDLDSADLWIDRVWRDLRFEAPWQSASERLLAREALARFLNYQHQAERQLLATEERRIAVIEVPTPDGGVEHVRIHGLLDRIEIDDMGRQVAIDLKNMKNPPPDKDVPEHAQLGMYQLLLRENGAEVGGAALVQLRVGSRSDPEAPKVQLQPPLDGPSPTWIELELGEAAELLRSERFEARPNDYCKFCAYQTICPTQGAGEQVVS
ncbi:MAG: ATP-dependent DNA helicase [Actinomycetota bacterium]|nr:ATP-dependent DNA helicase [Actinomycetota bacterium]